MLTTWNELSGDRLFSPKLWKGLAPPVSGGLFDTPSGNPAIGMFDDFFGWSGLVATHDGQYFSQGNRYLSYEESSNPVSQVASVQTALGAIALTSAASDDTSAIAWGNHLVTPYNAGPFSVIPGTSKDLVFEARFKVNTITAAQYNFCIGLSGQAGVKIVDADVPITGSDAFATTASLLVFNRLTAGTTGLNLCYERASGTVATVSSVGTLAADTYVKAGFRFNSLRKTLDVYVDGEEVVAARRSATVTGTTPWPNQYLCPIAAVEGIASAAGLLTIDWWACAQYV
jgi:hypothetical protein